MDAVKKQVMLRREMERFDGGRDDVPELSLGLGSGLVGREEKKQFITIFYDGRVCVGDVTEIQARAIISMAKRDMEENSEGNNSKNSAHCHDQHQEPHFSSPGGLPAPAFLGSGLSMKRSLQRFLQKRKTRAAAVSPYVHRPQSLKHSPMS